MQTERNAISVLWVSIIERHFFRILHFICIIVHISSENCLQNHKPSKALSMSNYMCRSNGTTSNLHENPFNYNNSWYIYISTILLWFKNNNMRHSLTLLDTSQLNL